MKLNFRSIQYKNLNIITCALIATVTIFSSCSKENKAELTLDGNLQVSFDGIEGYESLEENTKTASITNKNNSNSTEIISYNGFDAITSFDVLDPSNTTKLDIEVESSSSIKKLAIPVPPSKIASTVKYRLIFFKTSDNSIAEDKTILAGEAPRIRLNVGTEYKWIAYSINESTIPSFNVATQTIDKKSIANKDFLYASNTITIQPGDNYLNLVLKRYTTQYEVNIDVRGMFATIHDSTKVSIAKVNADNSVVDLFQTKDFNILTGNFEGTATSLNIKGTQLKAITTNVNDKKTVTFYSIPTNQTINANQFAVKFDSLVLKMDDNSIRKFKNSTVKLSHKAIAASTSQGRKFVLNAMLVESGIKVVTDPNTTWARSNLWYAKDSTITGEYRFRVSPHFRDMVNKVTGTNFLKDINDLWKFSTKTPDSESQTIGYDPCADVYPKNLWKLPSDLQYTSLKSQNPDSLFLLDRGEPWWTVVLGLIGNSKYYEMSAMYKNINTAKTPGYGYSQLYRVDDTRSHMDNLYFSGIGRLDIHGTIYERPVASSVLSVLELIKVLPVISGGGFYWTSKGLGSTAVVAKPTYYEFSVDGATVLGVNLLEILKLNVLEFKGYNSAVTNTNFLNSTNAYSTANWRARLNIRCVRNSNYPNAATYTN